MKKSQKITKPPVDNRPELYFEIDEVCLRNEREEEQYGRWEKDKACSLKKVARNKDFLSKWNFTAYKVPDIVYNADSVYVVSVVYSSGDSFGSSSGNFQVAFVTEDPKEALRAKEAIEEDHRIKKTYTKEKEYKVWSDFRNSEKLVCGKYFSWDGYFENIEEIRIDFLKVIG
jgi:hypothetical protein